MKNYILVSASVLAIASGWHWLAGGGTPTPGNGPVTSNQTVKQDSLKPAQYRPNAHKPSLSLPVEPFPGQGEISGQATGEPQAYDLNNPDDLERFAASMRAEGHSEEDIRRMLKLPVEDPPPDAMAQAAQAQAYDLNNPADRERFAASMRAEGATEDDIQHAMPPPPGEPSPLEAISAKAQAYDMNDPSDRERFAASLRAGGADEVEVRKILGK